VHYFFRSVLKSRKADGAGLTNALYALSRSSALALGSLVPFFFYSRDYLFAMAAVMVIVQALDAVIGSKINNRFKTYGPLLTAIGNPGCLIS